MGKTSMACASEGAKGESKDLEDCLGKDDVKVAKKAKLLEFVFELNGILEKKLVKNGGTLGKIDFQKACTQLQKRYGVHGKSTIIHAYRELVAAGRVSHKKPIENLCVKKLGRSAFGGVNLSIFIPPGHSAPVWNVVVSGTDDESITVEVTEKKSVYTLLGYRGYTKYGDQEDMYIDKTLKITEMKDETLVAHMKADDEKARVNLFDLSLDEFGSLDEMPKDGSKHTGMLKGTYSLTTCTFGCVYCPTEVDAEGEQTNPKSYLTHEPGVLRAVRNGYDTAGQVYDRLGSLIEMGHDVSKVFVRCVGGTWSVVTSNGQSTFVRDIIYALNTMNAPRSREPKSLPEELLINETGPCRAVEICVEDHPKMVTPKTLLFNRSLGITAMEMGIQTTNDEIHRLTKRDSTRAQLVNRADLCKQFGFKVLAHIMPDLPGSTPEIDKFTIDDILNGCEVIRIADYRQIIMAVGVLSIAVGFSIGIRVSNVTTGVIGAIIAVLLTAVGYWYAERMPEPGQQTLSHRAYFEFDYDRFKLYPTMVLEFSEMKDWYLEGKYKPYYDENPDALYDVMRHFLETVKPYQRVERVVRDMPASRDPDATADATVGDDTQKHNYVVAGICVTNAQEIAMARLTKPCVDLRSREIKDVKTDPTKAVLCVHHYYANKGEEYFISMETPDHKHVYGFLKLRLNEKTEEYTPKELTGAGLIRWLQVYGVAVPVGGDASDSNSQHLGFGKRLMAKAEEVARSRGATRIADISGIGVREYYRKIGYHLDGTYMVKEL